jgi:hypothetical protein
MEAQMRKTLLTLAFAGALSLLAPINAPAAPANGAAIPAAVAENPLVQQARVFCYNRYTGRFVHWGYCGRRHYVRHYYHPRVYCMNRRTHRFLHWGHC